MQKLLLSFLLLCSTSLIAQIGRDGQEEKKQLNKTERIQDRAGGTHNASNVGLFFENRGKLYPRTVAQGPSGQFPINSGKDYIYRINPMVGIPGNVIQCRYTTNEEWEAAYGYHNSDTARISLSTDVNSWDIQRGWPIKDLNGENIILSDQDSYCVYNDSNNTKSILGIQVNQTGYAFGTNFAKNILFFKYDLTNNSSKDLDSVYFSLYCDIDVGNISGGTPEYGDDKLDFDKSKNLLYFFDDGLSAEWPDGKTGFFGISFLKTPKVNGNQLGITDMHYNIYDDDLDIDSVQYGIMSSSPSLYQSSIGGKYFHLGGNSNLHFDNPTSIPSSGLDILANISSGPYTLKRGDTLTFYTAFIGGNTLPELMNYATVAQNAVEANFKMPTAPVRPKLSGMPENSKATLYWDDKSELSYDEFTGFDFEGYRLYRSKDKGRTWEKLTDFDLMDAIGENTGLQYSYIDTTVINGMEYWYSITAYDKGNETIESLESPLGNTLDAVNTIQIIPRSDALDRTPVSVTDVTNLNSGSSNFILNAKVIDQDLLKDKTYKTTFGYVPRIDKGDLHTNITIEVTDSNATKPFKYNIEFTSANAFDLKNITTNTIIRGGYPYPVGGRDLIITGEGLKISLRDSAGTPAKYLPKQGDIIAIDFSMNVVRNNSDSVINNRPFQLYQTQVSSDGLFLKLDPPEIIKNVSRIGGTDDVNITFKALYPDSVITKSYIASIDGSGSQNNNGYVLLSVSGTNINKDTLFNSDTFLFEGIEGTITFPAYKPPLTGNKFSLQTEKPIQPNIKDSYSLKIKGSSISQLKISDNMNKIKVVPNPYLVSSIYEPEYGELRKEPLRQIQITNLPSLCTIYIFTAAADLVKTIHHESTNGTEVWDLKTDGGRELAAGVYIILVKTKDAEYKNLFSIIK